MSNLSERTTVYLHPQVKRFLQHKAVAEGTSLSEIINDSFADLLEDLQDVALIQKRRNEKAVPLDEVLQDLGISYEQLRD